MKDPLKNTRIKMLSDIESTEKCVGCTAFVIGDFNTNYTIIFADIQSCCVFVENKITLKRSILRWENGVAALPF